MSITDDWERNYQGFRKLPTLDEAFEHAFIDPLCGFIESHQPASRIDAQKWRVDLEKAITAIQIDTSRATVDNECLRCERYIDRVLAVANRDRNVQMVYAGVIGALVGAALARVVFWVV